MNNATLVETLRPLPRSRRVRLSAQVDRLRRVCGGDSDLESFQGEVLEVLSRMFGAAAGAFWFRPWGGAGICPSVRTGFQDLSLGGRALGRLDAVVSQGWQATQPLIQPLEDLDALVLVGPIRDGQSAIGAVQLVVVARRPGTSDAAGLYQQPPAAYGRALTATLSIVQPALLRRMQIKAIPLEQAEAGLRQVQQQIAGIQRSIRLAIERYLQQLTGATFGSLEENQQFVKNLQRLLDSHGLRVRCPECGHPAILRCARNASISSGAFVFDHYLPEGRTFHGGGRTLPALRTVAKPSRRKSSS